MDEKDFMEMVLQERISMLLKTERSQQSDAIWEDAEHIFSKLEETDQKKVEAWRDMVSDQQSEYEKAVYLGGLMDGIRLAVAVVMIGAEGLDFVEERTRYGF